MHVSLQDIGKKTYLEDAYGKPLLAREVFKHAIAFLRNDLKAECTKQFVGGIHDTDVLWVLTVPAIWNETAKHFMREAAEEVMLYLDVLQFKNKNVWISNFLIHAAFSYVFFFNYGAF